MRQFRGKRVDNGEWYYGSAVEPCYILGYIEVYSYNADEDLMNMSGVCHEIDTKTVGQMIGLKDKNGKDIYEGDLIYIAGKGIIEVKLDCCGYWSFGDCDDYQDVMDDIEYIAGNIHENHELLEND